MLPIDFQFSQACLQDFVDCRRRFWLRYIKRFAWPAIPAAPAREFERYILLGNRFHHLVHQHRLGIPVEKLSDAIREDELHVWWENYLKTADSLWENEEFYGSSLYAENILSTPLNGYRLIAKYDLLVISPQGKAMVVDWKTSRQSSQSQRRRGLTQSLQTSVYPYVLVMAAGSSLNASLNPDHIEMVYWFTNFPNQPERFQYDKSRFDEDKRTINDLSAQILSLAEDQFTQTPVEHHCRYCVYRSYCERGVGAGEMDMAVEIDTENPFTFDFDQVIEISF